MFIIPISELEAYVWQKTKSGRHTAGNKESTTWAPERGHHVPLLGTRD